MHRREERHGPVVGHHRSGEAPLIAQHLGKEPGIGASRNAVDIGIGVHHRSDARSDDGRSRRAGGRHRAVRAGPSTPARDCGPPAMPSSRRSASLLRAHRRSAGRARRPRQASLRDRDPHPSSPRLGPTGSRARRQRPGTNPGAPRAQPCPARSPPPSAPPARGRTSRPRRWQPDTRLLRRW